MSFASAVVLTLTDLSDQTFDATSIQASSTVRRDATQPLDQPQTLTISHETTKGGAHVNTAVMLDRVKLDSGDQVTLGSARALLKLSFDNQIITAADLQEMVAQLKELCTEANITKLLNKEH